MKNTLLAYIDRFRHDRRQRAMLGSVLLVLAVIVTLLVYWQLRLSGIAMTNETYCGYEEHVHTDECYEYTLICELEETGHVHDESCYEEQQVLVCGLEESEGHTHSESCYDEEGNLVCGLEESEGHTHSEACYETQTVLICGQEETPDAHVHTDECYEKTLICELEEHTHTVECLIDLTADVEDETIWSATIPELTGDLRTDIVAIANSQVGYTESTANYSLGEDGITHYGYTRYGAWYGSEYADWDSIFAAFCLDYAGIADEFSYNAGSFAWTVDLANLGYYQSADSYVPSAGDLVFVDTDLDGRADKTAVVVSVDEVFSTVTAIQGNYTVTDADGNSTDTVAYVTYSMTATAAPVLSTISEDGETVDDVVPVILGYANVTYAVETTDEETAEDEVIDDEEIDLEGETDEEITDEEITDETTEPEVVGSAAVLTYTGEDYTITVIYGEDALIPEGTYLVAYEYSSDSETYLQRYAESAAIYGWEGEPTEDFRVFNIGLYYDGVEIEPAAEIQVSITYTAAENSDSVSVTHHDETAEPLYAVSEYSEETGTETVTFTTDGFSDYSFMLMSTGNEEGNNVTGTASNSSTGSLYTDLDGNELADSTVSWTASNVSYADGSFSLELDADFSLYGTDLDYNKVYYIYLPDGITVSDNILGVRQTGKDTSGTNAFGYYFMKDSDGNYYVQIVFDVTSYVDANKDKTDKLYGDLDYSAYKIDSSDVTSDTENVYITYEDNLEIVIPITTIDTDGTETWTQDLTVSKSSASYDSKTNSITYTVYVSSETGTGDTITLEDVLTLLNNQDFGDGLEIMSIDVTSVKYEQNINYGTYTGWGNSTTVDSSDYTVTVDTSAGTLSMTLEGLSGADDNASTVGDRYVITYTVAFSTDISADTSVTNKVTASSSDKSGTIDNDATATTSISYSIVDKTDSYDANTGTITWTVTLKTTGDGGTYTLKDDAFAQAYADGTLTVSGGTYTITKNTDGSVSITVDDSVSTTYTITYTTTVDVSFGSSGDTISNTVGVYDENGKQVDEDEDDVKVSGGGSLAKSVEEGAIDSASNTRILKWTTAITVPQTGISAGTTLYDYLTTNRYSTSGNGTASEIYQWFTYDQIMDLFDSLSSGIKIGNTTITSGYTLYAITDSRSWNNQPWISYSELQDKTTYGDYLFTAYKIVFDDAITASGEISITYETTADLTGIDKTREYANIVQMGSLSANAYYVGYQNVYKADGDGKTTDTAYTSTDGVVTWKVYIHVDSTTSGKLVVTDTLPKEVSLTSITIQTDNGSTKLDVSNGTLSSSTLNGATIDGTITGSVDINGDKDTTSVVINVPEAAYETTQNSSYVILTYTCEIDGWDDLTATISYPLTNSVEVTLNGDDYGGDTQTQTVTYEDSGSTSTDDHDAVEKVLIQNGMGYDNNITYGVVLNLDEEVLNNGDDLTLTDVLGTTDPLTATLDYTSVKFYQLYEITEIDNGDGTYTYTYTIGNYSYSLYTGSTKIENWTASDTTVPYSSMYAYLESDKTYTYYYKSALDISWDYEVVIPNIYYSVAKEHTITAEVPDATAILLEYTYYIDYTGTLTDVNGSQGAWVSWTNTATLTGSEPIEDGSDKETVTPYVEETTSGSITNAGGLTIHKVGLHTSDFVPDTEFELYVYDSSSGTFKSTGETYTTDQNGTIYITPVESRDDNTGAVTAWKSWFEGNTLYYLVETKAATGYVADYDTKYYFYWEIDSDTAGAMGWATSLDYSNLSSTDLADVEQAITDGRFETVTLDSATSYDIKNTPITSFTLKKTNKSNGNTIAGATFALYRFAGHNSYTGDEVWIRIGTYVTDSNGEIIITYDPDLYSYDTAYKIVEVTPADGYNIGYGDVTEFYFWWSTENGSVTGLSNWGTDPDGSTTGYEVGREYETAINISEKSEEVTATNTKTTTAISATKIWLDSNGDLITDTSGLSATVQLYYYLYDPDTKTYARGDDESVTKAETKLVSLTTSASTTTATLYNYPNTVTLYNNITVGGTTYGTWYYNNTVTQWGTTASAFISALLDTTYDNSYIEVSVTNASSASSLSLLIQGNENAYYEDNNGKHTYQVLTSSITGTVVSSDANETIIRYSVSDIVSALESNTYITTYLANNSSATLKDALTYYFNSVVLQFGNTSEQATMNYLRIGAPATAEATVVSSMSATASTGNGWSATSSVSSGVAKALQESGARIRITYDYTSGSSIRIGIQTGAILNSGASYYAVAYVNESGYADVYVSDIIAAAESNGSGIAFSWSDTLWNIFVQGDGGDSLVGNITSIDVIVPVSGTSSEQTYTYSVTDSEADLYNAGTSALSTDWTTYLTGDATAKSALATSDSVIYISYTCTSVPSKVQVGIQYTTAYGSPDWYDVTTQISTSGGYITVPVSSIVTGSYSLDDYNAIVLTASVEGVTIDSVSILVPYDVTSSLAGVVVDTTVDGVVLYNPTFDAISISGNDWNVLVSTSTEASGKGYDYTKVNSTYGDYLCGYAFFNAIYSNIDSELVITLSNVSADSSDIQSLLKDYLEFVVQGDTSVDYSAIASNIKPTKVVDKGNNTYEVYYSSSDIVSSLSSANGIYDTAAKALADYFALCLKLNGSTTFSADVTGLKVVGTLETSDTYTSNVLTGYAYGIAYSDDNASSYTYELNASNGWTISLANLPLTMTKDGVEYDRYYYFVEVGTDSTYTTTYSQVEGENGGGEVVIVNSKVATTDVSVTKVWEDTNGTDVSQKSEITNNGLIKVSLYYYLVDDNGNVYTGGTNEDTNTISFEVATGYKTGIDGNVTSYLVAENQEIAYDTSTSSWDTWSKSGLPAYKAIGTTKYNCYYYFVETYSGVNGTESTTYSNSTGITGGIITITNVVSEDAKGYALPSTGGQNERIYILIGLTLMVLALLGCAYRNIRRIRFSAASNDTPVRKPSKPGAPNEAKLFRRQKKLSKDRNGDSRAGPKS